MNSHVFKKRLGQNFLRDIKIQQKIIQACHLKDDDTVLEIGPGQGAITRLIAPCVKKLVCVETDRDLIEPLRLLFPNESHGNPVEVIHADFLKWDMSHLPSGIKIVGNIPYYISTPIIEKIISERARVSEAFLTVQLEFGERLIAKEGGKEYGSLTCFVQYYADIKMHFKIKNASFKPAPRVDSCFISIKLNDGKEKAKDEAFLFKLIQTAFQQRRKNIVNALKGLVEKEKLERILQELNIDPKARPENLTLLNYINICNSFMI